MRHCNIMQPIDILIRHTPKAVSGRIFKFCVFYKQSCFSESERLCLQVGNTAIIMNSYQNLNQTVSGSIRQWCMPCWHTRLKQHIVCSESRLQQSQTTHHWREHPEILWSHYWLDFDLIFGCCMSRNATLLPPLVIQPCMRSHGDQSTEPGVRSDVGWL